MNDTQTQIERLIELAIVQRTELKQLVEQLPELREHLNAEIERTIEEIEPQLRSELEEFCDKRAVDANAKVGSALEAKMIELSKSLEVTTQARFNAIKEQERKVEELRQLAAKQIEGHVAALPEAVKEIVGAELARFPRAGEIDQLRKEFAEPKGLNPRGKWLPSETYNRLDLVTYNGDSFTSAIDGNRSRPSRNAAEWTLIAARGTGGGGPTSLSELTTVPSNGDLLIGSGTSWVTSNLTAGAGISITVGAGEITISATDGDITLDDGTAASPSLHFTNDADTGIYRPAANTLGISTSGVQRMYVDQNGITTVGAGGTFDGSVHAANGNANNPSFSFSGDQDTGFFRHQPNEIGIALGGTQYATLTSTTFSITPVVTMASSLRVNGTTDSSSKDTGAIVTEGGLGVEKSATIGGNLTVSGYADLGSGGIGTPAAGHIQIGGSDSYGAAIIGRGSAYDFGLFNKNGDDVIHVATGTTNVAISGNLTVIGTGTTGGNLRVRNALGYATGIHTGTTSDSTQQLLLSSNAAYNHAYISKGSTALGIGFSSDNGSFVADDSITITAATKLVTLAGNLTVSGTGTSSVAGLLDLSAATAGQIKFPASQNSSANANTLDDYEEGTWTPTDQSGASLSFTVYNAVYTKVGRLVEIQAAIYYPSTVSSASAKIGGLPFNAADGDDNTGGICLSATNVNLNFTGLVARNNNQFFLETIAGSSVINSNMSAKYIKFFGWYYV